MNTTVKVSQLHLSRLNVRRVEPTRIEEMAADILAHGIVQSLAVYEEDGKYCRKSECQLNEITPVNLTKLNRQHLKGLGRCDNSELCAPAWSASTSLWISTASALE